MNPMRLTRLAVLFLLVLARPAHSQGDVYWHIDPTVKSCSMVIDPSLTQGQWETFVREAGATVSFKSLAPAHTLGRMRFNLGVDYSMTPIDQHDPAWVNTFAHPDADCPLGDRIEMPALRATLGVSNSMDVTGFWTTNPEANYGFAGGALKYAFHKETAKAPAAAVIGSFTALTGVADFNMNIYGVAVEASKRFSSLTPYVGIKETVSVGTETTTKVDLESETIPLTHGFVGVTGSLWKVGLAAEYSVSAVNTFAFMIAFHP